MLTDDWQDRFDIPVTLAGAALYRAGAVRLHAPSGRTRHANVRDRRTFDVHLDGDRAGCTCRMQQDSGPCAHVWAVFLALDALPPEPAPAPLETGPGDDPDPDEAAAPGEAAAPDEPVEPAPPG